MDRSAASTAAFGAAADGRVADHEDWPEGVRRPDLPILLSVPESVRQERIGGRGRAQTAEERRLARDLAFRERVLAGYRAAGAVIIDAARPVEAIVDEIAQLVADGLTAGPPSVTAEVAS